MEIGFLKVGKIIRKCETKRKTIAKSAMQMNVANILTSAKRKLWNEMWESIFFCVKM